MKKSVQKIGKLGLMYLLALSPLLVAAQSADECVEANRTLAFEVRVALDRLPHLIKQNSYVLSEVSNNRVLLVGQTTDEATQKTVLVGVQEALQNNPNLTQKQPPLSIVNKITVGPLVGTQRRIQDNFLALPVERVLANAQLKKYQVRFIVMDATVYLLGVVTVAQADEIVAALQSLGGIRQIVKAFEYVGN